MEVEVAVHRSKDRERKVNRLILLEKTDQVLPMPLCRTILSLSELHKLLITSLYDCVNCQDPTMRV